MNYKFGTYDVVTTPSLSFFAAEMVEVDIYFNGNGFASQPIDSSSGFVNDADALDWATDRIKEHKESLSELKAICESN